MPTPSHLQHNIPLPSNPHHSVSLHITLVKIITFIHLELHNNFTVLSFFVRSYQTELWHSNSQNSLLSNIISVSAYVNAYCAAATGCQHNCTYQILYISHHIISDTSNEVQPHTNCSITSQYCLCAVQLATAKKPVFTHGYNSKTLSVDTITITC